MPRQGGKDSCSWELLFIAFIGALCLGVVPWPPAARSAPLLFTQEPMIVSQEYLSGTCVDSTGAERSDLEEWTSTSGACDRIVCHVEPSGNYTVTHSCRPREPAENPDTTNCVWETDSLVAYPDCCPKLSCGAASVLTTVDPTSCFDIASAFACGVWANLTTNCTDMSVDVFNYSQVFCRSTCGIC
ncbi:uncharacterized protein LOC101859128 [Aplysia californica]|uniref:Uncharacterized protein LOC101859128 n=1 Tax=Aplysia californica TaxID=6500 RepID=A0ABM1A8S4_APLCA|nr:uncharacterized protein LOC101859128 [Aplysia californica]